MTARIDAHCHVWDLEVRDQPWIDGDAMAGLRRSFGITELANTAADSGVGGVVVVQTVADVAETEELLDLAAAEPLIVGVVGWVDLEAPDAAEQLDRLIDRPSGRWLAGVRSLVQAEPDPRWLLRPGVLAGLGEVAARELTFDLLVRPHQLPAAVGAVTAVPSLRFVLDHLAKPAIASGAWEPWAGCVAELARQPNVWAKVSGLVTEAAPPWCEADIRPYADHAIAAFGPDRLLFGSDWPVCTLAATYRDVVDLFDDLVAAASGDERAAMAGGNALAFYSRSAR